MDATPSDFAAGGDHPATGEPFTRARGAWRWAPLALGAAIAVVTTALQQLGTAGVFTFLTDRFIYTHQAQLQYAAHLLAPGVVALAAIIVALRAPGIARRGRAAVRLLAALALESAAVLLALPALSALLAPLMRRPDAPPGRPPLGPELIGEVVSSVYWIPLGVTLAIAMGVLTPGIAPRAWRRRLGYWLLAGALAGLAAACFALLDPLIVSTLLAARLGAVGAQDCQSSGGSFCYGAQVLYLARLQGLGRVLGATIGAAIGGFLAPQLAHQRVAPDLTPAAPDAPGERRSRGARMRRYLGAALIGVLYATLEVSLIYAVSPRPAAIQTSHPPVWVFALDVVALLIPAGWLALVVARSHLAALNPGGRRALRWTLFGLAALTALAVPAIATLIESQLFPADFVVTCLIAFSFGAVYGLVWSPGVHKDRQHYPGGDWRAGARAAFAGWLGVAIPAAVLIGFAVYSLVTYNAATGGCHGLGCGALLLVVYASVVTPAVYLVVYGLLAAAAGGALAGLLRATLVAGSPARNAPAE
jgi:hypothetical protein